MQVGSLDSDCARADTSPEAPRACCDTTCSGVPPRWDLTRTGGFEDLMPANYYWAGADWSPTMSRLIQDFTTG
jgi:hypothetical protein